MMELAERIADLRCPYCEGGLRIEETPGSNGPRGDAVVACACASYPIVHGIPILKQAAWGSNFDTAAAIRCLRAGDAHAALMAVLPGPPSRPRGNRIVDACIRRSRHLAGLWNEKMQQRRLVKALRDEQVAFPEASRRLVGPGFSNYLVQRFANPSFLSAVALMPVLAAYFEGQPEGRPLRILDLACGAGHLSFEIQRVLPQARVTAVDLDYRNLFLAARHVAPGATCLCVDAEFPLPFPDNYFDAVLCLDAFHYIRPKASLIRDVARVAKDDALWLFPHLHNALQRNPSAGIPLSPQDYSRCFRLASPRLFAERELLTGLTRSDALDLRQEPSAEALAASPALSVVGSRREGTWRLYERASGALIRASAPPVINPIYRVREEGDRLTLQMEWPDEQMRRECIMLEELLPLEVTLDRPFFTRVSRGEARPDDREKLQELVRTFVLVHLPKSWGQAPARPLAS